MYFLFILQGFSIHKTRRGALVVSQIQEGVRVQHVMMILFTVMNIDNHDNNYYCIIILCSNYVHNCTIIVCHV